MKWVRDNIIAKESGLTVEAIRCKKKKGIWVEGEHWVKGPDGRTWYNKEAIEEWVVSQAA